MASTKSSSSSSSGGRSRAAGKSKRSAGSQTTTDHETIRRWCEERGGRPAAVGRTRGKNDVGLLRLDFPGYSGEGELQPISWDQFFEKFDREELALVFQESTAGGQKSNFNKLVSRASDKTAGRGGARKSAGGKKSGGSRPGTASRKSNTAKRAPSSGKSADRASKKSGGAARGDRPGTATRKGKADSQGKPGARRGTSSKSRATSRGRKGE